MSLAADARGLGPCDACGASAGMPCRTASGRRRGLHAARRTQAAIAAAFARRRARLQAQASPEVAARRALADQFVATFRAAHCLAAALRGACHSGPCPACSGGEIWSDDRTRVLGTCIACGGHAVQDCSVAGCERC